jgi:hypothetical protein
MTQGERPERTQKNQNMSRVEPARKPRPAAPDASGDIAAVIKKNYINADATMWARFVGVMM